MKRSEFDLGWGRLVTGFGKQQTYERADVYYAALQSWDWRTWDTVTRQALSECKFFPSVFELNELKGGNVASARHARHDGAKCKCGICPGDGMVTIFAPAWLERLRNGEDPGLVVTSVIACGEGGFYRLASWARKGGGAPIIAPTLPVPNYGRLVPKCQETWTDYARSWLREHTPLGQPVTSGVFAEWNNGK